MLYYSLDGSQHSTHLIEPVGEETEEQEASQYSQEDDPPRDASARETVWLYLCHQHELSLSEGLPGGYCRISSS